MDDFALEACSDGEVECVTTVLTFTLHDVLTSLEVRMWVAMCLSSNGFAPTKSVPGFVDN